MTAIIAKIGPQHFSESIPFRLQRASDWQGKTIAAPLPKHTTGKATLLNDYIACETVYIWTHVDPRKYPEQSGQGLCARAEIATISSDSSELSITLGRVDIISPSLNRQYLDEHASEHNAIKLLLEHTTSRALFLESAEANEFAKALEKLTALRSKTLSKRQVKQYALTLYDSYYDKGFFNLGKEFSDALQSQPGTITVLLGRNRQKVTARLDRTAQSNGTPRIHGGRPLTDWFQENFNRGDTITVTVETSSSLHLGHKKTAVGNPKSLNSKTRLLPVEQIQATPPNVWLTSFYGFAPDIWGFIGWTKSGQRERFIKQSKPGALMVVYGTKGDETHPDEQGKLLGIYECSHKTGQSSEFLDPVALARLRREGRSERWRDAIQCTRAWEIAEDERPYVDDFAHLSYSKSKWREIGSQGVALQREEAEKLLNLTVTEVPIYKGSHITDSAPTTLKDVLTPSQAGPNATRDYTVSVEPDSPKSLYIFKLNGDVANYLNENPDNVSDKMIVKVGLSKSPAARLKQLQSSLPAGAYHWEILRSTVLDGDDMYSCFDVAVAGEDKMKLVLDEYGRSLGGEFFLADIGMILRAWVTGKNTALAAETMR